jgi:NADH:ubiquinone reductase (H+-translocating)
MQDKRPHVLIIGGGFGGLTVARALNGAPVRITLLDKTNHHLFQPLLFQVALAALSPAEIGYPIRAVLRKQSNARVVMDEALSIDLNQKTVHAKNENIAYDYLVLSTGVGNNYFGHDNWAQYSFGLKDLKDALAIRQHVLAQFEEAELIHDPEAQRALLTFLVIGAGPTGVELAGCLAELARTSLVSDFRNIHPETARIILLEGTKRVLPPFPEDLSLKAADQLRALGVEVRTEAMVTDISETGAVVSGEFIPARTILWCAGVKATEITKTLGVPLDRAGRVIVADDLSIPGHPEAFVIGDVAACSDGKGGMLPGVAPAAMQAGHFVAQSIRETVAGKPRKKFHYIDKGSLATIGRSAAVADLHFVKLSSLPAWLAWLCIHILFIVGFRNKFVVVFSWVWSFLTSQRGARLIIDYSTNKTMSDTNIAASESAPTSVSVQNKSGVSQQQ